MENNEAQEIERYRQMMATCDYLMVHMPDCPPRTIKNTRKNYRALKTDNILYHLLELVPQLVNEINDLRGELDQLVNLNEM
jgi:hypothetical protein